LLEVTAFGLKSISSLKLFPFSDCDTSKAVVGLERVKKIKGDVKEPDVTEVEAEEDD
jgi:hypothetical protein